MDGWVGGSIKEMATVEGMGCQMGRPRRLQLFEKRMLCLCGFHGLATPEHPLSPSLPAAMVPRWTNRLEKGGARKKGRVSLELRNGPGLVGQQCSGPRVRLLRHGPRRVGEIGT
jgi:hypothetical protein